MPIRAIVFDIGGVLEITPDLGLEAKWEQLWQLPPGSLAERLHTVWQGGSLGTLTEAQVHAQISAILGQSPAQVNAYMADVWREYLGTLNTELAAYFRSLRPRYQTAILSNSFVGAREREQALYGFADSCDFIIYSHEVGLAKPDPRIYALTCERLGRPPAQVIFLDDRPAAITAANAFGMHGIIFKNTKQAIADIETCIRAHTTP